jgi:murein L,D-transpeptidase YafK
LIKILLFISLLVSNNFADDLIDLYRLKGLIAVEKVLEQGLEKQSYWNKFLSNKNTDFGYYENKKYILVTEKKTKKLSLYKNEDNDYKLLLEENVITGEKEGDKFIEGDKKTPVGAYLLTQKKTNVDQFYGPLAIVTSYPNTFDKTLNKKGHGIWIHGMPLNEDRESYTQGCIALGNPKLQNLDEKIDIKKSILLTSQDEFKKAKKEDLSLILASIFKWKKSWKESDIQSYLKFYSHEFKRFDGMDIRRFSKFKKRIFAKREKKKIHFSNIDISPYPNTLNKTMYKVIMDEIYRSPSVKFDGKKELFLEIINNEVKILAEG